MVAVTGSPAEPQVIDRRRIEIADPTSAGSVQPYHTARDLGITKAQKYLDRSRAAATELAAAELRKVMNDLGGRAIACGILMGSGKVPGTLEATLASHPAIHTAEGEFFRETIIEAAAACKLRLRKVREKELFAVAGLQFGMPSEELRGRIDRLGKILGPPWRQDEKYAALVAWLAW
jgi:hypothetical protein